MGDPLNAYLVCGGLYHDIDFARAELLKLLGEDERVRTRVGENYRDVEAIGAADLLVTYTCDVKPSESQQEALAAWVSGGGRWLALHGTNSVFEVLEGFRFDTPRSHPKYMEVLGSQFLAHPPIEPYRVVVSDSAHPLVQDIEPFDTEDELYLCEYHGEIHTLLETRYTGKAPGFTEEEWPDDDPRPVMYLHPYGSGEVLYLTLGHCRGRWDMRPLIPEYPRVERGSWELPVFYELLRRSLAWATRSLQDS